MKLGKKHLIIAGALSLVVGVTDTIKSKLDNSNPDNGGLEKSSQVDVAQNEIKAETKNILEFENLDKENEIEGIGMTNIGSKIKSLNSIVSSRTKYMILDLIKSKQGDINFNYNLYYTKESEKEELTQLLISHNLFIDSLNLNFIYASAGQGVTTRWPWVRDGAIIMLNYSGEPYILESKLSRATETIGSNGFNKLLSSTEGIEHMQSKLIFQGGNIRQNDEYIFIGSDDIIANINQNRNNSRQNNLSSATKYNNSQDYTSEEIEFIIQEFEKEFGKKIIPIGINNDGWEYNITGNQPVNLAHIDTFMTPISSNEIVIKRPSKSKKEIDWINKIIENLETLGFTIIDLPEIDNNSNIVINYNNVLIEEDDGIKKVYLPQYSYNQGYTNLRKSDLQAIKVYENNGFKVIPIRIDIGNIKHRGSLNCLTFEIREPYI